MFAIKNKMMPHLIEGIFNEIWDMRQPEIDQLTKENERLKESVKLSDFSFEEIALEYGKRLERI